MRRAMNPPQYARGRHLKAQKPGSSGNASTRTGHDDARPASSILTQHKGKFRAITLRREIFKRLVVEFRNATPASDRI
jgi:hypothetical protein